MSDTNRHADVSESRGASGDPTPLAAYRHQEPSRGRDPFGSVALQRQIAEEARARAARQHGGPRGWISRWFRGAPRPALAGAALSLALLVVGLPLASPQTAAQMAESGEPVVQMSALPATDPLGARASDLHEASESVATTPVTPWPIIAGAIGLAVFLLAAERGRRRRRA